VLTDLFDLIYRFVILFRFFVDIVWL
jgi:hypothetical protein